jgi:hypothetical protein
METFNVLSGCSERRINNHIEIALREVCYEQALVQCHFTHRLDAWLSEASTKSFHLLVLAPEHMIRGIGGKTETVTIPEACEAVRTIKNLRPSPILAVTSRTKSESLLLEAGVERVFPPIFNEGILRDELRRVLNLSPAKTFSHPSAETFSFATFIVRSLQRFRPVQGFQRSQRPIKCSRTNWSNAA